MTARNKFLIIIAAMVAFSFAASIFDTVNEDIDIPFVPDLSIGGRELPVLHHDQKISADQMIKELSEIFDIKSYMVQLADRNFQVVKHDSMLELIDWMEVFYWKTPHMRYKPESYDCDNFARTFVVFADLAGIENFEGQITLVRLYVTQKYTWAGVPAGGGHALVAFRSDKGWFVYEPQGRSYIEARKYPNREHVFKILGD